MRGASRDASGRVDPTTAVAVSLGVLAALVRLPRALTDPFWQDEVASARILREPTLTGMLHHVARTESTPPLWYLLGWLAHRAGLSIHDVRLLSVVFGGLLVATVVQIGSWALPLRHAALAGVLVAFAGDVVAAGRDLRAYELAALLTATFALALDACSRRPTLGRGAVLAAVTAAGALTHYFFAFTVAAGLLWLWLEPHMRPTRIRTTLAVAAGLAACAPWAPALVRQYGQDRFSWIGAFDLRQVANTPLRLFTPLLGTRVAPLAFLAVALAGAVALARRSPRGRLCAMLAFVPLLLAGGLWLAGIQVFAPRNMIGIAAFVAVAAAAAVASLGGRAATLAGVVVAAALVAGFARDQRVAAAPYSRIAQILVADGWNARDPIVVFGSYFAFRSPLEWYLPQTPVLRRLAPADDGCRTVYAVAGRRAAPALASHLLLARRVGAFIVARLGPDPALTRLGASVLAAPPARCARSVAGRGAAAARAAASGR